MTQMQAALHEFTLCFCLTTSGQARICSCCLRAFYPLIRCGANCQDFVAHCQIPTDLLRHLQQMWQNILYFGERLWEQKVFSNSDQTYQRKWKTWTLRNTNSSIDRYQQTRCSRQERSGFINVEIKILIIRYLPVPDIAPL